MAGRFIKESSEMVISDKIKDKLFLAVEEKNLEAVKSIVDALSTIGDLPLSSRKPWFPGSELIINALKSKQLEIAKLLISLGFLSKGSDGVLLSAIIHGDLETIKMLEAINNSSSPPLFNNNKTPFFSIANRFLVDEECSKIFDHLLAEVGNINKKDSGFTILHAATECGNENIIPLILDRKCDINSVTNQSQTALHIATEKGYLKIVSLLLERGAKHNLEDVNYKTPLYLAAEKGIIPIIEILLDFTLCKQNKQDWRSDVADLLLYCAATAGKKGIVEMLLLGEVNLNKRFRETGKTPLFIAVENGREDVVKFLLDKSADPKMTLTNENILTGDTVLHIAAEKGHEKIVKLLLQYGADPLALNIFDKNPLHSAAEGGSSSIIADLLNSSSISSIFIPAEKRGYTPFDIAVENSQEEAVKVFLEKGFSADCTTKNGLQPLHIAAQTGHNGIILLLLKYGTRVDFVARSPVEIPLDYIPKLKNCDTFKIVGKDSTKCKLKYEETFTALYVAAYYGHEEVVQTLLDKRANPNVCFKNFLTPLYAAAQEGHQEIVELLLRKGAKVNLGNSDECFSTPLLAAAQGGHEGIVELLLQFDADPKAKLRPLYEISRGIEHVFKYAKCSQCPLLDLRSSPGFSYLGYTSLHFAVEAKKTGMVEMLLKCGADVNAETEHRRTPLHLAVSKENISIVNKLIDFGASLDSLCAKGLSPFFYAVKNSRVDILKTSLIRGASFETKTSEGVPLLHFAINCHSDERTFRYLLRCGAEVNAKNIQGLTVLHRFLHEARPHWKDTRTIKEKEVDIEMFKLCVESCSDVNISTKYDMKETVLHMATKAGRATEVDILLVHGADVNKVDKDGKTPLFYALKKLIVILDELRIYEASLQNFEGFMSYNLRDSNYRNIERFETHRRLRRVPYRSNDANAMLCRSVACSITQMIAMLVACKSDIHSENLAQVNSPFVKPYYDICKAEIEKMRVTKIMNSITFFDILVADEGKLAYYAGNKTILETLQEQSHKSLFPEYARFLKSRIERGLKRKIFIEKSLGALKIALDFEFPFIISYQVLGYLSLIELMNLCKACMSLSFETLGMDEV